MLRARIRTTRCPASPGVESVANVCAIHAADAQAANVCAAHAAAPVGSGVPCPGGLELPAFLRPLVAGLDEADTFGLDARLRRAVRLEQRLDAEIAPLLRRVASRDHTDGAADGAADEHAGEPAGRGRPLPLASLARDRLGMSPRKARALVRLERLERLGDVCPELRAAWRDRSSSRPGRRPARPDEHLARLPTFLLARALSYLGWSATRARLDKAARIAPSLIAALEAFAPTHLTHPSGG